MITKPRKNNPLPGHAVSIYLPHDLTVEATRKCEKQKMSFSEAIRKLLQRWVDEQ